MLFVSFLFFATSIWAAEAKTFKSLVGARVVSALACAASEGLVAAINADLFFLHERGWWMGVYLVFLCGGVSLGGLVSGFVINAMGWRWHFWVSSSSLWHSNNRLGLSLLELMLLQFFSFSLKRSIFAAPRV